MRRMPAECDLKENYIYKGNTLSNWARAQLALAQLRVSFYKTELLLH